MRIHIHLPVTSLAASEAFYTRLFGEPSKKREDYLNWRLEEPRIHLSLVQGQPSSEGHHGVELRTHEELEAWRQRTEGLPMRVQDDISCCYAKGDKFWLTDPDGREWEFWVRTGEASALAPKTTDACCEVVPETSSGCCG